MSKRHGDPLLDRVVRAIEESPGAAVPITVSVRGAVLHGELISQETYFSALTAGNPLLGALGTEARGSGHEGKRFDTKSSDGFVHLRGTRAPESVSPGVWRIALRAVDAWTLATSADDAGRDGQGEGSVLGSIFGRDADH